MDQHTPAMRGAAYRYVRTQADIDDATQEAWLAFARAASTITQADRVGCWLCTTTARAALSIARKRARHEQAAARAESSPPPADSIEAVHGHEAAIALREAISRLGPKDKQLAELLLDERELSYASLSLRLGRPIGSIGPSRQRLFERLRRDPQLRRLALVANR